MFTCLTNADFFKEITTRKKSTHYGDANFVHTFHLPDQVTGEMRTQYAYKLFVTMIHSQEHLVSSLRGEATPTNAVIQTTSLVMALQ
jgi:hypothetical protein